MARHKANEPNANEPAQGSWRATASLAPLAKNLRANSELMTQFSQIMARASQAMAVRQATVLNEAMDDLSALLRQAMPSPDDPSAPARAYAAYMQSVFKRGVAQLSFSVESVAELSTSALELARRRYVTEPGAAANPPAVEIGPRKK